MHQSEAPNPSKWRYIAVGTLLGCALTLVLLYADQAFTRENPTKGVKTFVASIGPVRPAQGRIAGQIAYATYPTPWKRPPRVSREVMAAASTKESPRDQAFFRLLHGELDAVISILEEALRLAPGDATLLSDLSVVYGERARAQDQPEDYVMALEMAERAIEAAPGSREAVFNRAVALENLFLYDQASKAWRRYLEIDSQSGWADEARSRIKTLAMAISRRRAPDRRRLLSQAISEGNGQAITRLASEGPLEAREFFEEELLPTWAETVARDQNQRVDLQLAGARRIAKTLARRGGDRIFLKIVNEMESVANMPSGQRENAMLVQSLLHFKTGQDAFNNFTPEISREGQAPDDRFNWVTPMREFVVAEQGLRSIGSAVVLTVRYRYILCLINQYKFSEARVVVMDLGRDSLIAEYPSLRARQQRMLGWLADKMGDPAKAVAAYSRALESFKLLGESPSVADTQKRMASSLQSLGQLDEAWRYSYHVLAWSSATPPESQLYIALMNLYGAVYTSLAQRHYRVALNLQNHLITLASEYDDSRIFIWTLLFRAQVEATLGRQEDAEQDFQRALRELSMTSLEERKSLAADFDITRRMIKENEDRVASLAEFGRIDSLRADLSFTRGDVATAENDIERALGELERQRANVTPGRYRVSFFDQALPLYERMIALQLYLGQPERSLEVWERFRARTLLDQLEISEPRSRIMSGAPLDWRGLCNRMPKRTIVVVYAVIEGRLVTWLVQRDGIRLSSVQPSWPMVSQLVQRLLEEPKGNPEKNKEYLRKLYQLLVAPWRTELQAGERIIFIPTGPLYSIPFAALHDPGSGRFLVQDYTVGISPSASQFIAAVERDRRMSKKPLTSTLLVGDPAFDRFALSWLPALPSSAQEIEILDRIYRDLDTRVLIQREATPARVLSLIGRSDIVHIAVHAKANRKDSAKSSLLLSSNGSDPGFLTAQDILGLRLTRTRLVMLASCETNAGPISASEGSLSLTSAFLAAGVPAVVGSLWEVDDGSTIRVSVRFHQELRRGADALAALRTAQLAEMERQNGSPNWTWASFQIFGGVEAREPRRDQQP